MRINLGMSMSNIGVECAVTYDPFSAIGHRTVGSPRTRWSGRQNLAGKLGYYGELLLHYLLMSKASGAAQLKAARRHSKQSCLLSDFRVKWEVL